MLGRLARNLLQRNRQLFSPARVLLIFFILVIYLVFPFSSTYSPSLISNHELQEALSTATSSELADIYDRARLEILRHKRFNSTHTAQKLRSPTHLPDGTINFDPDLSNYIKRLTRFVDDYFANTPESIRSGARKAIKDLTRHSSPSGRPDNLPTTIWSTHPSGIDGVEEGFSLWGKLLPLPLSDRLMSKLSRNEEIKWLKPAREGQSWEVIVTDDDDLDNWMSEWTSETIVRSVKGEEKWSKLWGSLGKGVLRADLFRYIAMFVAGGIYSDSDTMPISHPYVWGLNAPSILNPDIEILLDHISKTAHTSQSNQRSKMERSLDIQRNNTKHINKEFQSYIPPYNVHSQRSPIIAKEGKLPTTILNPEISIIVAVEWDSMIGRTLSMWRQWTFWRLNRSWPDRGFPRGLQMVQNLLVSKPFHPIMLDTLATIAQLVDTGIASQLGPLELTSILKYVIYSTDAVLRYLLVQYGVTPEELRSLRGPVRVGDVLILQEEAWHAPDKAIRQMLVHIASLGHKVSQQMYSSDPWLFGLGWEDWQSGGVKVAYHGLTGIWKNKGQ